MIQPPQVPTKGKFNMPNFSGGNGLIKSVAISLAVTVVCLVGLASFMNGGDFVTKKDFTKNLGDMSATINTVKANMDTTKKDVTNQIQTMPSIIDTNVNKAVTQATNTWEGKMTALTTSVSKTQADTLASIQGMQTAINNTASQTNTQINSAIIQANTSWDAKYKTITDRVTALESNYQNVLKLLNDQTAKNTSDLATLSTRESNNVVSLNSTIQLLIARATSMEAANQEALNRLSALQGQYNSVVNRVALLETQYESSVNRITSLETRVATLEGQYALTQVSINTSAISYSLISGATSTIPVLITNANPNQVTIPVKLDLTTSGNVSIVSASMGATYTVTVNGANATFFTSMTLPANSSITFNIPFTISYNGSSPNVWTAVWSKR